MTIGYKQDTQVSTKAR